MQCLVVRQDFLCACPAGYEGDLCETDINECASGPCVSGATCEDRTNGYECRCRPGFEGEDYFYFQF